MQHMPTLLVSDTFTAAETLRPTTRASRFVATTCTRQLCYFQTMLSAFINWELCRCHSGSDPPENPIQAGSDMLAILILP